MMEITLPHKFSPRAYQLPLLKALDRGLKRAVIVWNRRSGKDKTCFNYMIKRSQQRVGTYFYFLPSYKQAKKVIWDNIDSDGFKMLDHIPKQIIRKKNDTELKVELTNGSIIQLIAADEFKDSGVGTNPIGVVFSEYSVTNNNAWNFVSPILAANGGWAIFNFTPRGMNHAFTLLQMARSNDKWFSEVLTVDDTKVISAEDLEEEKKINPADLIEQEWYCKFIEGAGAFFRRVRENIYPNDFILPDKGDFQVGADYAKHQDWTVLTPFNLNHFVAYPQERFNKIDWNLQKAKTESMCFRHSNSDNEPALLWPDATGVGDPIVEDLKARGLRIGGENEEGFKFTETSRMNLLNNLSLLLEQNRIKIPNDEGLIGELLSMRYEITDRGKVRVQVPDSLTDDRIMSLALSVWGVTQPIRIQDDTLFDRVWNNRINRPSFK